MCRGWKDQQFVVFAARVLIERSLVRVLTNDDSWVGPVSPGLDSLAILGCARNPLILGTLGSLTGYDTHCDDPLGGASQ